MEEDYLHFTDFKELPEEARKAYGKINRANLSQPIIMPKPKYLGKADWDSGLAAEFDACPCRTATGGFEHGQTGGARERERCAPCGRSSCRA